MHALTPGLFVPRLTPCALCLPRHAVHAAQEAVDIMLQCLEQDPGRRPTAAELVSRLGAFVDDGGGAQRQHSNPAAGVLRVCAQLPAAAASPFEAAAGAPLTPVSPEGCVAKAAPAPTEAEPPAEARGEPGMPSSPFGAAHHPQRHSTTLPTLPE